jgi:hypothetical protein
MGIEPGSAACKTSVVIIESWKLTPFSVQTVQLQLGEYILKSTSEFSMWPALSRIHIEVGNPCTIILSFLLFL